MKGSEPAGLTDADVKDPVSPHQLMLMWDTDQAVVLPAVCDLPLLPLRVQRGFIQATQNPGGRQQQQQQRAETRQHPAGTATRWNTDPLPLNQHRETSWFGFYSWSSVPTGPVTELYCSVSWFQFHTETLPWFKVIPVSLFLMFLLFFYHILLPAWVHWFPVKAADSVSFDWTGSASHSSRGNEPRDPYANCLQL